MERRQGVVRLSKHNSLMDPWIQPYVQLNHTNRNAINTRPITENTMWDDKGTVRVYIPVASEGCTCRRHQELPVREFLASILWLTPDGLGSWLDLKTAPNYAQCRCCVWSTQCIMQIMINIQAYLTGIPHFNAIHTTMHAGKPCLYLSCQPSKHQGAQRTIATMPGKMPYAQSSYSVSAHIRSTCTH